MWDFLERMTEELLLLRAERDRTGSWLRPTRRSFTSRQSEATREVFSWCTCLRPRENGKGL